MQDLKPRSAVQSPAPYRWLALVLAALMGLVVLRVLPVHSSRTSPSPVLGESGHAYKFLSTNSHGPAVWPCDRPITVALNAAALDSSSRASVLVDLQASLKLIESASGFRFKFLGPTSATPTKTWGYDWVNQSPKAQVVVAIVPSQASDLLVAKGAAIGGSFFKEDSLGHLYSFSGYVVVRTERFFDYVPGPGPMSHQALLTHEMLHVLNLDHVDDPDSLLTERLSSSHGMLGPGDIEGLAVLHAKSCSASQM